MRLPQRQLLDAIAGGELDDHLVAIADAVQARRQLLHAVNSATALAQLCVGDTVVFNRRVRPRYLENELGMIAELDDRWVTVRLWRRVGRFRDGELRCPPLALRKLDRASGRPAASA
jgi:xanthine/CO dehydrogenase XdhC/CoxF family maturation factor